MKNVTKLKTAILALGLISGFSVINANAANEAKGIIRFSGKVTDQTCDFSDKNLPHEIVNLRPITKGDFEGINMPAKIGSSNFRIQAKGCKVPTDANGIQHKNIYIKFIPDLNNVDNSGYLLPHFTYEDSFTDGSREFEEGSTTKRKDILAEGVVLKISDKDDKSKYINLRDPNVFSKSQKITEESPSFDFTVEYFATRDPANIRPGKVTAKLEYVFDYN